VLAASRAPALLTLFNSYRNRYAHEDSYLDTDCYRNSYTYGNGHTNADSFSDIDADSYDNNMFRKMLTDAKA